MRILIGSTEKCGISMNTQDRLIALHDLSISYRLRDLEQRAGRINKIVALDPLSVDDYKSILTSLVRSGLQQSLGCRIYMDSATPGILAE